jgi:predicted phosphoribosyltransferase
LFAGRVRLRDAGRNNRGDVVYFQDRIDAAEQLAIALQPWRARHPLVLAIARGAVPMGQVLADRLEADFDVVLVRKLRAPFSPELAVGAIDESGWAYIAPYAGEIGANPDYLAREKAAQLDTLRRRRALYTPGRAPIEAGGRVVIVVDDGLATGATMIAALHSVRARQPSRLICAVPVGAPDSVALVAAHADEMVCLHQPAFFGAVGRFYADFRQVEDDEVVRLLAREKK